LIQASWFGVLELLVHAHNLLAACARQRTGVDNSSSPSVLLGTNEPGPTDQLQRSEAQSLTILLDAIFNDSAGE